MVVPFDSVTISRTAAAEMFTAVQTFCGACRDLRELRQDYRYQLPTSQESLYLCQREIDKNQAALKLVELVSEHIINPNNFD